MLDYLQSVFGAGIKVEPYVFPADVPFYIRDGYSARILSWGKNECLAVKPFDKSARLSALKKHIQTIAALCGRLCVLELDGVTAAQRRNLLESRIPFISKKRSSPRTSCRHLYSLFFFIFITLAAASRG